MQASTIEIVLLLATTMAMCVAFVRMPNWCSRSIGRHALWRLRDRAVDSTLAGDLPDDHPAVQQFLRHVKWTIEETSSMSIREFYIYAWVWRKIPTDDRHPSGLATLD